MSRCLLFFLLTAFHLKAQYDFTDLSLLSVANVPVGFNPTGVSGLALWYRAQDYSASPDGTSMTNVLDKSTAGNHATNPAAWLAPVLTNNIVNGKAAFVFVNQSNYLLQLSNTAPFGSAKTGEVYAVLRSHLSPPSTVDNLQGSVLWQMENISVVASNKGSLHPNYSNEIVEAFGAHSPVVAPLTWNQQASNWHIFNLEMDSSKMKMRWNGELIGGNDLPGTTGFTNSILIGAGNCGTVRSYFSGDIAEILVYTNALSTVDRSNLTVYLGAYYGISTTNTSDLYGPTNFSALAGWWDSDSFAHQIPSGAAVTNWTDLSLFNRLMTNGSSANRPIWHSNVYNGHSCVSYDANKPQTLYVNPQSSLMSNASGAAFTVISTSAFTNFNTGIPIGAITYSAGSLENVNTTGNSNAYLVGAVFKYSAVISRSITALAVNTLISRNPDGAIFFFQNMTNATRSPVETNLIPGSFATLGGGNSRNYGGNICEMLYYQTNLSFADLTKLYYTYLRPKWGLP